MSAQTDMEEFLRATSPEEQVKVSLANLKRVQQIAGYLPLIWMGLLMGAVLVLIGHFFLGRDIVGRVKGTSWLLTVAGLMAVVAAVGAKGLATTVMIQSDKMSPILKVLLPDLVKQFFGLGQTIGGIIAVVGLGGVVTMGYLVKSGRVKVEKTGKPR